MVRVADLLKRESNIFDALRLFAAALVLFSHSYALAGFPEPGIIGTTFGALGVRIFFILSGLLIAASWMSHPRFMAFLGKRILRIIPALVFVVLLAVFVIGPIFTTLSLAAYFSNNDTWAYLNTISVFGLKLDLPGVFMTNHATGVNGSLWTLPYEVAAYLLVAFLGWTYLLKKKKLVIGLFAACILLSAITINHASWLILFTLNVHLLFYFLCSFLSGVLCYLYRDKIVLSWKGALIALFAIAISGPLHLLQVLPYLALPYLVLYVGSLTKTGLGRISKYGDFSYGMYIFAWPVQQAIVELHNQHIGPKRLFAYSFIVVLLLAIFSWRYIEKPMLKLKSYFSVEKYPILRDAW